MKKRNFMYVMLLILVLIFTSCSAKNDSTQNETTEIAVTTEAGDESLPVFSAEELAKYNGKDGNRAYVAYEGKVYDVTDIPAWNGGVHQNRFEAGKDYTEILNKQAPHSPSNLTSNAPIVGIYE